jgi:hypothetical protein
MPSELAGPVNSDWGGDYDDGNPPDPPVFAFAVDNRTGDLVEFRPIPQTALKTPVIHVPLRRDREPRPRPRRARRAGTSRDGPSSRSDDDPPEPEPLASRALVGGST